MCFGYIAEGYILFGAVNTYSDRANAKNFEILDNSSAPGAKVSIYVDVHRFLAQVYSTVFVLFHVNRNGCKRSTDREFKSIIFSKIVLCQRG